MARRRDQDRLKAFCRKELLPSDSCLAARLLISRSLAHALVAPMIFVLTFGVRLSQLAVSSRSSKKNCELTSGAKRFPRASSPKSGMCRPSPFIRVLKRDRSLGHPLQRASV